MSDPTTRHSILRKQESGFDNVAFGFEDGGNEIMYDSWRRQQVNAFNECGSLYKYIRATIKNQNIEKSRAFDPPWATRWLRQISAPRGERFRRGQKRHRRKKRGNPNFEENRLDAGEPNQADDAISPKRIPRPKKKRSSSTNDLQLQETYKRPISNNCTDSLPKQSPNTWNYRETTINKSAKSQS